MSANNNNRMAQMNWEMLNKFDNVNSVDEIYKYDASQQQGILAAKPWEKE